ncbi:rhamnulose-1-phosphate aldolase [Alkalibacterium olivapovliticus]|uniref:Rhamnulose-1-phosphate aldolase n=1 Tax=Alkalibacterium olivapovliticus TaxID=99907 RepID=A0A2T0VUG6_9LACT|nr:rhamnulose-1-phosphate aldolase [Alkalibacterium olivapovliticus]PRY75087.1 rhamnulose-1-phosphate aldolase [Alkalibacterium olivapovliticus]
MTKKEILTSPFVEEMCDTTRNMYEHGWDERNGGNISYLLSEEEVAPYLDVEDVKRTIPIDFDAIALAGKCFIVTGSGKYFKNVHKDPETNLGVIRVGNDGSYVELLWGYKDGSVPTSELPSHFQSHISRLEVDLENRVIMHCHATHLLAMTFTHSMEEKELTRKLWQLCTECLVVFPEGVSTIPWIVPGTNEIGEATSAKMKETRLVIWPQHGVYGAGKDMDETFGLIETVEKAAEVYTYVQAQGGMKTSISDENLKALAERFEVVPREGYLSI